MLVLSRKPQQAIRIGDNVWITIVEIKRGVVRLGIDAPREIPVMRAELLEGNRAPKAEVSEAA